MAFASLPTLAWSQKHRVASEWLRMNSTAFSPRVSYSGTQYTLLMLHACMAIIHSGELGPYTAARPCTGRPAPIMALETAETYPPSAL